VIFVVSNKIFKFFFTKQDVFYLKLAFQTRCWYFFNYVRIQVNLCIFMFLKRLIYLFTVHTFSSFLHKLICTYKLIFRT